MEILRKVYSNQFSGIFAILIIAATLRMYHLGFQSLWVDEIFTMNISNPDLTFAEFNFELMLREGFPYLYFYILHFFYAIFGYSVETARLVSVVGGVVGVYATYLAGSALYNRKAGLLSAFLMAISEYNIQISQDARPYSLYVMATIFSFYRLALFIKNPTLKNAVWYGIFTGLILNLNFFGFINVLSQVVIILFFLVIIPNQRRIEMFKHVIISGIIALLLFLPNYKKLMTLMSIKSFWVSPPGPDSFSILFREFLGNSEMTLFIFMPIFVYYLITLFKQKDVPNYQYIIINKLQFSFLILFGWAFVFIAFLMFKSYSDISLILARYFTSITPVFVLVIGIGICLIRNRVVRCVVIGAITIFTFMNLLLVKDYYNKVTKTQFREISKEILEKNKGNEKVVSTWGWLFNYYLKPTTKKNTLEAPFDVYVTDRMNERVDNLSFWYVDGNSRPYSLSPDLEAYLDSNFTVDQEINYYDTWAKHYKSKKAVGDLSFLTLNNFKPSLFDGSGAMIFVENMTSSYPQFLLKKGVYEFVVKGVSLPDPPLNGENAHFRILINGSEEGNFNLSEKQDNPGVTVNFVNERDQMVRLELQYDNDAVVNNQDRNAVLRSIQIKKK